MVSTRTHGPAGRPAGTHDGCCCGPGEATRQMMVCVCRAANHRDCDAEQLAGPARGPAQRASAACGASVHLISFQSACVVDGGRGTSMAVRLVRDSCLARPGRVQPVVAAWTGAIRAEDGPGHPALFVLFGCSCAQLSPPFNTHVAPVCCAGVRGMLAGAAALGGGGPRPGHEAPLAGDARARLSPQLAALRLMTTAHLLHRWAAALATSPAPLHMESVSCW